MSLLLLFIASLIPLVIAYNTNSKLCVFIFLILQIIFWIIQGAKKNKIREEEEQKEEAERERQEEKKPKKIKNKIKKYVKKSLF